MYKKGIDRIGEVHGARTLLDYRSLKGKKPEFYIKCDFCKSEKWMRSDRAISNKIRGCGCQQVSTQFKKKDLTGKIINHLQVISDTGKISKKGDRNYSIYLCKCLLCKNDKEISAEVLQKNIKDCGCTRNEKARVNAPKNIKEYSKKNYVEGTSLANVMRSELAKNNTSGYTGVFKVKSGRYQARKNFKSKCYYLGTYDTAKQAGEAVKIFTNKYIKPVVDKYK